MLLLVISSVPFGDVKNEKSGLGLSAVHGWNGVRRIQWAWYQSVKSIGSIDQGSNLSNPMNEPWTRTGDTSL